MSDTIAVANIFRSPGEPQGRIAAAPLRHSGGLILKMPQEQSICIYAALPDSTTVHPIGGADPHVNVACLAPLTLEQ